MVFSLRSFVVLTTGRFVMGHSCLALCSRDFKSCLKL